MRDEIDSTVRRLAEKQYGVFSRVQADTAGARGLMRHQRVEAGRWVPVGAAGYRMAGAPMTWRGLLLAALWDAGPRSMICGAAAAQLHRWPGYTHDVVEVLVPKSLDHLCQIATIRESRRYELVRSTVVGGIPVTAPEDTLVHLARSLRFRRTDWLVDELLGAKKIDLATLQRVFADLSPGCRGMRALRATLQDRTPGDPIPNTELEKLFLGVVTSRGLPRFERQVNIPGRDQRPGRVDFFWPDVRLIVEVDGRRWHTRVRDFERDSKRRLAMLANGYPTAPVTWAMLTEEPDQVCADLLAARHHAA
jgi:very-short-patch-repair endonuclease